MIKDFIASFLKDYQKLIVTRFLLVICFFGGFMFAILILAILLMLVYPPYVWCVFGGFVVIWLFTLLFIYGYFRIVKAENRVRQAQLESVEYGISALISAILTLIEKH